MINVYCENKPILPFNILPFCVNSGIEAILQSQKNKDDFLIIKNPSQEGNVYRFISQTNHKILIWCHNFILSDYADYLSKLNNVAAVVFVGKQQYDRYMDHDIIKKSVCIYNIVSDPQPKIIERALKKYVVYLGALTYVKGFHILASIWNDILNEVPDAELFVLGTGQIYSRDKKMGKFGVASEDYERLFMPYLLDKFGNIIPSVHFMGIAGQEKYNLFCDASVGIVNPSGRTETFGMGVIEMNSSFLPVVTINKNGYPDTVKNGINGYLCNNKNEIKDKIVYLLKNPDKNRELGIKGKQLVRSYSGENILPQWLKLFESIMNDDKKVFSFQSPSIPFNNNFKCVRVVIRFFRYTLHLKFIPPLIKIETFVYKLLRK